MSNAVKEWTANILIVIHFPLDDSFVLDFNCIELVFSPSSADGILSDSA